MATLIIAEKPTAMKKISEILDEQGKPKKRTDNGVTYYEAKRENRDLIIVSALGHLYTIEEIKKPGQKGWVYPVFDTKWVPAHIVLKRKRSKRDKKRAVDVENLITNIENLSSQCESFINACDYDLEGATIGYNILRFCCGPETAEKARRMKFSTLTKKDILNSYENPLKSLNFNLIDAGLCRHEVDYVYGINLTHALTLAAKTAEGINYYLLSIGRVQGPTLAAVFGREKEINVFVPKPYWQINANTLLEEKEYLIDFSKGKIKYKKEAEKVLEDCKGKQAIVKDKKLKDSTSAPPIPFNLSSLQSESYRYFGYTPSQTLNIAERLYLGAYISYPRTSSEIIPETIEIKDILTKLQSNKTYTELVEEVLSKPELTPTKGKKSDPAHPPILPTGEIPKGMRSNLEKKLYDLIVRRFLALFGDPAIVTSIRILLEIEKYKFYLRGRKIKYLGWMKYYPFSKSKEVILPDIDIGQKMKINVDLVEKYSSSPARFNQNSLRKFMEKEEIGTKATRASIIDILFTRGYIFEKSIHITDIGAAVSEVLNQHCPQVLSIKMTRELEIEMQAIERGEQKRNQVTEDVRETLEPILMEIKDEEKLIGNDLAISIKKTWERQSYIGKCDKCEDGNLKIIRSRATKKRFIGCTNYPDCQNSFPISQRGKIYPMPDKICSYCQDKYNKSYPMVTIRIGGGRPFTSCINWVNHEDIQERYRKKKEKEEKEKKNKSTK
ncbi:MAG: DNA topoisomerase I [Candidatus Helarchaeota archaeon]|nr:DNA topoisomerase I [Candidatus Helarchaeota archaeon]